MLFSIAFIVAGAAIGSLLRWCLGIWLAQTVSWLSFGTLAANWIGAYLIGVFAALFARWPEMSPNVQLFLITGFLGSLTTFSGFSLEVVNMLQAQRWGAALLTAGLHLFGSLCWTILGMMTVATLRNIT
ncbi:MAG: fluoride efflux transporter CrcB [Neisseria sp.]|uniref:fluoride efflux transporter CrcB n=1 Tax=Neisseria sp. TaxID=192066 RepID=UPI0026DCEFD6|nr:fluoride efflux transporter CrcB [Neisseria sp.]MDO4641306.1 fluoride efflux transporter CrcB [Neisseria sp.]